ncbi:hypothetical protein SPRG_00736 [Saprolegnia parasitica CBS 223.65]|uniref:Cysteine/serine-rich nuclear protein N-terminal domain-containing protein n=1 Tax=Saprolegnia parasitica (strain CBS 223.65) TaxID=695850 RepID=A0A067CW31_SAPPC|nr:hypothetical protein SPRG_00736 [Saprolegnia parasitica CBS 223.65]KDO34673.1 hypothetical protein SPRG_00736 [Saprolegnia parasitica CBS 223.65]|eukprot:XP_012194346.1 hypothetical protein SPRG_00736 [Saprolegnia parasitica CBS 223.65]
MAVRLSTLARPCAAATASPLHVDCDLGAFAGKRVAFSSATTYEFAVAYGGSAIPSSSGPPIGLARLHSSFTTTDLRELWEDDADNEVPTKTVRKFEHLERIALLKRAGCHVQDIAVFCLEAMEVRNSRAASVDSHRKRKQRVALCQTLAKRRRLCPWRDDEASDDDDNDDNDDESDC